jgi:Fe-S-cluster containining protein
MLELERNGTMVRKEITRQWTEHTTGRECGSCYACCIYLVVEEIHKCSNERCVHLTGSGHKHCGIYNDRPTACKQYECAWRDGWGPEWLKPNRSGMLVTLYRDPDHPDDIFKSSATVNIFDESKTNKYRIERVISELLLLGLNDVRVVNIEKKTGRLYHNGFVYHCKLMPPEGYESLTFEAEDEPIGAYLAK